jgi:hypothetical protein
MHFLNPFTKTADSPDIESIKFFIRINLLSLEYKRRAERGQGENWAKSKEIEGFS